MNCPLQRHQRLSFQAFVPEKIHAAVKGEHEEHNISNYISLGRAHLMSFAEALHLLTRPHGINHHFYTEVNVFNTPTRT